MPQQTATAQRNEMGFYKVAVLGPKGNTVLGKKKLSNY